MKDETETWSVADVGKMPKAATLSRVMQNGNHILRIFRMLKKVGEEENVPFLYQENSAMPGIILSRPDVAK